MGGERVVTELMRRRRATLMSERTPEWRELSSSWTYGRVISESGVISSDQRGAISGLYQIPNAAIKRTGPTKDGSGTAIYFTVHEYNGSAWLKKTTLYDPGDTVAVSAECTQWRIAFYYPWGSGKKMNSIIISSCFGAEYKEA